GGNALGGWLALARARRGRARSVVASAPAGGWDPGSKEEKRLRPLFRRMYRGLQFAGPRAEKLTRRPRLRKLMLRDTVAFPERVPPRAAAGMIRGSYECSAFLPLLESIQQHGPA